MPKSPKAAQDLPDPAEHRDGETTPAKDAKRAPKQPHERDESASSQEQPAPNDVMQQAHDDVERGLVDTSRAEATDRTYGRNLRSEPQESVPGAKTSARKTPR